MNDITLREAYLQASLFLEHHKVMNSRENAELLLGHLLGWDRTRLLLHWNELFPNAQKEAWEQLLQRKAAGEPVQYIIGEQEFYGLPFEVNPSVLIPRPETEILVETIIQLGHEIYPNGTPSIVDIGTGSGAIPITIAVQCPAWQISTSDISPAATEVAKRNAVRNGVAERISFFQGDLLAPFIALQSEIDILISNPPYIPTQNIEELQPEVRAYEPMSALDGGGDGLVLYRRMIDQLRELAKPPRLIGFEVGMGQAREVASLLQTAMADAEVRIVEDYGGIERHVIAIKRL